MAKGINVPKLDKKQERRQNWSFFFRSYAIQASWNYEGQMNLGFMYGIAPVIDRIYGDANDEETLNAKKEAYKRHLAFYNCTPQTSAFVLGIASSMEEEYARNPDEFDPNSINAVKSSLMGPLSGVGDSFFQGTIKILAFGLGVNLAKDGSILGPIVAILISFIPAFLVTYYGGKLGYSAGNEFLNKLTKEGIMDRAMYLVTIVGLMVIGSMIASMIGITTPLHMGKAFSLQKTLDTIFPQMIPLAFTFFMYWLLQKKVSTVWILVICIASGLVLSPLGIFK